LTGLFRFASGSQAECDDRGVRFLAAFPVATRSLIGFELPARLVVVPDRGMLAISVSQSSSLGRAR
jgi:hypothetical protein